MNNNEACVLSTVQNIKKVANDPQKLKTLVQTVTTCPAATGVPRTTKMIRIHSRLDTRLRRYNNNNNTLTCMGVRTTMESINPFGQIITAFELCGDLFRVH